MTAEPQFHPSASLAETAVYSWHPYSLKRHVASKLFLFLKQDFRSTLHLEELADKMKNTDWVYWAQRRMKRLEMKRYECEQIENWYSTI